MLKSILFNCMTVVFCCTIRYCYPQNTFFPLGSGVLNNIQVRNMFNDSATNQLYAAGGFEIAGNIPASFIARWDGVAWDSMGSNVTDGQVWDIIKYNGEIIAGGSFEQIGGIQAKSLAKWNGTNWIPFVDATDPGGATVQKMKIFNNELYVMGIFDTIAGLPAYNIAKFNGVSWTVFPPLDTTFGSSSIHDAAFFNGELYVVGVFYNFAQNIDEIARFDGASWQPVPGFVSTGGTNCLAVYNNELYVGGLFWTSSGSPGNMLVKFDGNSWVQLPGEPAYQVYCLEEYGGKLYTGGQFGDVAGLPVTAHAARWDGTQWESLGGVFDNNVVCFKEINGELYIGGNFRTINGDTMNGITRYTGAVGVQQLDIMKQISIFPNPATEKVVINLTGSEHYVIEFIDACGLLVYQKVTDGEKSVEINISDFAGGVYIVRARTDDNATTIRLIKID